MIKFKLSCRQPSKVLKDADIIFVEQRDWRYIPELRILYPEAAIELAIEKEEPDWESLKAFEMPITIQLSSIAMAEKCPFPFYYKYPITSQYELNALLSIENFDKTAFLAPPLFFSLDKVAVKARLIPNIPYEPYLPFNPIHGTWIRPENLADYEPFAHSVSFKSYSLEQEARLFEVYKLGVWPLDINSLIADFPISAENPYIPNDVLASRVRCGQRCEQLKSSCHLCETALRFPKTVKSFSKLKTDKEIQLETKSSTNI